MSGWYDTAYGWTHAEPSPSDAQRPLAVRAIAGIGAWNPTAEPGDPSPGRRLRVFANLANKSGNDFTIDGRKFENEPGFTWTYAALLKKAEGGQLAPWLVELQLRSNNQTTVARRDEPGPSNPDLPAALQDLGDEITEDIREALATFDSPSHYYPGVDEGIEPVSDDHVELVIWALQRELGRELRAADPAFQTPKLPAAPLSALAPAVQRALVERRRLRYAQYGIGREQWKANKWSLWDVREDADWVPRRAMRQIVAP